MVIVQSKFVVALNMLCFFYSRLKIRVYDVIGSVSEVVSYGVFRQITVVHWIVVVS